jgi:2-iminobutanoate/2-iminopropanoate deaminase
MTHGHFIAADAPSPAGPYWHARRAQGDLVVTAGFGGHEPGDGSLAPDVYTQTRRALESVKASLEAAGASWADLVQLRVFLVRTDDFQEMNRAFRDALVEPYPTRSTVYVTLPEPMLVEIDALAVVPGGDA